MSPQGSCPGLVVNDIMGTATVHGLIGGRGSCQWKQLISGMHLSAPWNSIEYVVIPPGASCGRHRHDRTEQIYYVLSGTAEMEIDDSVAALAAGDLATTPVGSAHGTLNSSSASLQFLGIDLFAQNSNGRRAPETLSVSAAPAQRPEAGVETHSVDLSAVLTGPWRSFSTLDLSPGAVLSRPALEGGEEVLFVEHGDVELEIGTHRVVGERGCCVGVPPGSPTKIANSSRSQPLRVLSTVAEVS